jgi:hypothetical protein
MRALSYLKDKFSQLALIKKILVVLVLLVLIGISAYSGYLIGSKQIFYKKEALSPKGTLISGKPEEPKNFPNPITGELFKKSEAASWANQLPIGVMIENHVDARPQFGLSQADVVYEALAEGGITRFMAVYLQNDAKLEPIRSARPYYLDWISEYSGAFAHFGGSPDALDKINQYAIKDLNGLTTGAPFTRDPNRSAPHNVYVTVSQLRDLATQRGYKKEDFTMWKFNDKETALEKRPASFSLKLGFLGTACYDVEWRYDTVTNSYLRFECGSKHIDALNNSQLNAKTIIVETVGYHPDASGHARIDMDTIGSGNLKVFENGVVIAGSWKKDSRTSRTEFFDANGAEVKLNRGKIWVDIIPPGSVVTY